jgi:transcriptional regulator with XRE-family HTH domain
MDTFGDRVRSARDALGWTQERLAREAGVYSGVVVSRWEKGHKRPHDPDVIVKLAEALGVSLDWLLRGSEHRTRGPNDTDPEPTTFAEIEAQVAAKRGAA